MIEAHCYEISILAEQQKGCKEPLTVILSVVTNQALDKRNVFEAFIDYKKDGSSQLANIYSTSIQNQLISQLS